MTINLLNTFKTVSEKLGTIQSDGLQGDRRWVLGASLFFNKEGELLKPDESRYAWLGNIYDGPGRALLAKIKCYSPLIHLHSVCVGERKYVPQFNAMHVTCWQLLHGTPLLVSNYTFYSALAFCTIDVGSQYN